MMGKICIRASVVAAVVVFSCLAGQPSFADSPKVEPADWVKVVLDGEKLKYSVTDSGLFKLTMAVGKERTHLVLINSNIETYGVLKLREVWAVVAKYPTIPGDVAVKLLLANAAKKVGAFQARCEDSGCVITFVVQVEGSAASAVTFHNAIDYVSLTADAMELELTSKDDY